MAGLTQQQVEEQIRAGRVNENENPNTRTVKQIILENTLTFFNFINVVLLVLVLVAGSYKNAMFVTVIVINTVIGVIQELRAKKILDSLAILTASKARVIRDSQQMSIPTDELVLGDLIFLKAGDQIPADAVVLKGTLEVNESLLTGESDTLVKKEEAQLFSGSVVTSGQAYCQVVHVGKDNYAAKITREAKEFKRHNSELRNALNKILKVISIIIVPLGIALFVKQYFLVHDTFRDSVVSTVAGMLGMIPEGLILLTSVALTLGSIRLAQRKTLVQELYCIETLARVDVLCLDKTGTITEGTMCVERVDDLGALEDGLSTEKAMGNLMAVLQDDNATFDAMKKHFKADKSFQLNHAIPFSSDRKYSGAVFEEQGTFLVGAVQFLFPQGQEELKERCSRAASEGLRVLVLAHSAAMSQENELPQDLVPCALILITDVIRQEAPDTLAYFESQGVDLKVISGDDPVTVAAIARRAGLKHADQYVDATTLETMEQIEEAVAMYSVFGRVTPQQKRMMVQALKKQGHTVAMTGDGVNDVLALKESDCSVAMASGSDAAKNIANVVLLESNFAVMPQIVNEGRRVVNNIRMAASMFLIKTIFSVSLSILTVFFGVAYPFEPIQMSLISACAVGIPTFLLNQESNYEKIDNTFLRHVFMNAFPTAITITFCVFTIMQVCQHVYDSTTMLSTACVLVTGWSYMTALKKVYSPMNLYRSIVIGGMQVLFFGAALCFQEILEFQALEFGLIVQVFVLMALSPMIIDGITYVLEKAREIWTEKRRKI
ncbi:MAG: cation-translocating P-type ATPase [Lachnospiraceae bacterium]|nr:cation-translocating P-type ATPase [Lachnospiraceae bacterium]